MKLKGNYSADETYNIGDIVVEDGVVYCKERDGVTGSPKDTHVWGRVTQPLADSVLIAMDALELAQDNLEKFFLNDQTLILKAGEGESEAAYAITVDDSGDTPELAVAEVSD